MKKLTPFFCLLVMLTGRLIAQPVWNHTLGLPSDSGARLSACKVLTDNAEQIYVLYNYHKTIGPSSAHEKIMLKKYDENGGLLWSYVYDNGGNNNIRGYDMCLDANGNAYIAGGKTDVSPYGVLLLKVESGGGFGWAQFGNTAFNTDWYTRVVFRNNLIYARANSGVAVFDDSGNESYAISQFNSAFDVDFSGRIVLAVYASTYNLMRFTSSGTLADTDSTLQADRILCDYNNEIYLASGQNGMQPYQLVKHDSNMQYQWSLPGLPVTPPFGDFSYNIMDTGQNEFVLYGVSDSLIKFNPQGQVLWKVNTGGMDDYIISGKILGNGFILLTGTLNGFAGSDVNTKIFNTNGVEVWGQLFSGVTGGGSEFGVDVDPGYNGIYVISQLEDSVNIMKYANPAATDSVDFTQVCVDSVWIDSTNMLHVIVFNGSFTHMNYPAITLVSPAGDTISQGSISFFAHLGNSFQEYVNNISDTGITDFSNYTFLMNNTFNPDTAAVIGFCVATETGLQQMNASALVYPNPAGSIIYVSGLKDLAQYQVQVHDLTGKCMADFKPLDSTQMINCAEWPEGMYFLTITGASEKQTVKLLVQHP